MATIIEDLSIDASADAVWDAVRSVGEVHRRLAPGFVVDTRLEGDARMVVLPDEAAGPIRAMVEQGAAAIQRALGRRGAA